MLSVLVVDDERQIREGLLKHIPWDKLGIGKVEICKNGLEALELSKTLHQNILITDVRMPKMDGISLSHEIKDLLPDCKIIFLSGFSDKEYLKSAIRIGAVDYVEKPIDEDELVASISKAVEMCQNSLNSESDSPTDSLQSNENSDGSKLPFGAQSYQPFDEVWNPAIEDNFTNLLEFGLREEMDEFMVDLKAKFSLISPSQIEKLKDCYIKFRVLLDTYAQKKGIPTDEIHQGTATAIRSIASKQNVYGISAELAKEIDAFYTHIEQKNAYGRNVYDILRYINSKHVDSSLSVNIIAEHFHFSVSYLCTLFKKSTGKTINQYITEMRISRVKALLKVKNLKLYEIAAKTGFEDANYMAKIFKTLEGYTPSEFRERYYI